ncbi:MAG: ceramidase domain-containing protein [Betaproteobacteria bacterium]
MQGATQRQYGARGPWREWVLCGVALALLAGALAVEPIAQNLAYHHFADRRAALGVPNFLNVASNLAFLLVGAAGLALCIRREGHGATLSWGVLFLGAALVAVGSGYYHWAPDNASLVWDRLPMTVGFMGLFVALLSEHIHEKLERYMLLPALLLGAASVAWWHQADDLRFYAWVQFMPLVTISLLVALYSGRYTHRRYLVYGLACYLAAKVAEALDRQIYTVSGELLSGHTLKHLLAALALYYVYAMLRRRAPVAAE